MDRPAHIRTGGRILHPLQAALQKALTHLLPAGKGFLNQFSRLTGAILLGGRRGPYNSPDQRRYFLNMLDSPWDIHSKRELLETVKYMSVGPGFRKCQTQADRAWELCRCTQLLAIAFRLGWISRSEMIRRSCQAGKLIQKTGWGCCRSWA